MKTYIVKIEHGVQIRIDIPDEEMSIHDNLLKVLDINPEIKKIRKSITFETPISEYEFKNIPFSVLFDEMTDETFVFVGKEHDFKIIEGLLQGIQITK